MATCVACHHNLVRCGDYRDKALSVSCRYAACYTDAGRCLAQAPFEDVADTQVAGLLASRPHTSTTIVERLNHAVNEASQ